MTDEHKRIVEIGGIKVEIDMRHAKVIDHYSVGTRVKILVKDYSSYKPYPGIILGFDDFDRLPTIKVAYLEDGYDPSIKVAYVNAETMKEKYELCEIGDYDFHLTQETIQQHWDRKIREKENELEKAKQEKEVFDKMFGVIFSDWRQSLRDTLEGIERAEAAS